MNAKSKSKSVLKEHRINSKAVKQCLDELILMIPTLLAFEGLRPEDTSSIKKMLEKHRSYLANYLLVRLFASWTPVVDEDDSDTEEETKEVSGKDNL